MVCAGDGDPTVVRSAWLLRAGDLPHDAPLPREGGEAIAPWLGLGDVEEAFGRGCGSSTLEPFGLVGRLQ